MRQQCSCLEKENREQWHVHAGEDGQHQDLDRILRGRVNQNGRGQRKYVRGVVNPRIDDSSLGGGASSKIGSRPGGKQWQSGL